MPVTAVSANKLVITWTNPPSNGSPITSYRVTIRQADLTFTEDTVDCDGSVASIVDSKSCSVPLATLTNAPYSLAFGDSVFAKVVAINYYGESIESEEGNGAIIKLVPDAPVDLVNDVSITTAYVIGFTWDEGPSTGGAAVLDYRIIYDQSSSTFITLEEGITTRSY